MMGIMLRVYGETVHKAGLFLMLESRFRLVSREDAASQQPVDQETMASSFKLCRN